MYPVSPLGKEPEYDIRTLANDVPCLFTPLVGFLYEEVRRKTYVQLHSRGNLETAVTLTLNRQVEVVSSEHLGRIDAAFPVKEARKSAVPFLGMGPVRQQQGAPQVSGQDFLSFPEDLRQAVMKSWERIFGVPCCHDSIFGSSLVSSGVFTISV